MKKIVIISIYIAVLFMQNKAAAQEGEMLWSFYYNPATTLGDLNAFIDETSLRGFGFEGRRFMTDEVSLGGYIGYNGFFKEVPRDLYDINTTTINAKTWRFVYTLPILITSHYYIGEGMVRPFVGLGAGMFYVEQELQFGSFLTTDKNWSFGLAPEAGAFIPFGFQSNFGAIISVKYNHVFYDVKNIHSLDYINYQAGVGFTF